MESKPRLGQGIVDLVLSSRSGLFELLMLAILLAVGVNLISSAIPAAAGLSAASTLGVGLAFVVVAVGYAALRFVRRRTFTRTYEAFLIYDSRRNCLVAVPRYEFADAVLHFLRGAFAENPALEATWKKEPLKSIPEVLWSAKDKQGERPKSMDIVAEAVEYYVLTQFSTHLEDYFAEESFIGRNLRRNHRADMPHVLLTNRFLELFSRPMDERPRFVQYASDQDNEGTACLWNEDGTMYEKLDVVLPKESRISRPRPHTVRISTSRFDVSMQVDFGGTSMNLPRGFATYYLGITRSEGEAYFTRFQPFQVRVIISTEFHLAALLSPTGWEYYRWIDSFVSMLDSELSANRFLTRINWEAAYTTFMLSAGRRKQRA